MILWLFGRFICGESVGKKPLFMPSYHPFQLPTSIKRNREEPEKESTLLRKQNNNKKGVLHKVLYTEIKSMGLVLTGFTLYDTDNSVLHSLYSL